MVSTPPSGGSPSVTVVGSANLDQIVHAPHLPVPGETVSATWTRQGAGGKGLNQAVAAARMGIDVRFVGAVGRDASGELLVRHLRRNDVDTSHVVAVDGVSGTAFVLVDDAGENMILVASGANGTVGPLPTGSADWLECSVLLMQLELPTLTVLRSAKEGHRRGVRVVLNAAPASPLPDELLGFVDVLVVNEHECRELAGVHLIEEAAEILAQAVPALVVTQGARGALWYEHRVKGGPVAPPPVTPVDTTGAGDTFCGVLAALLANNRSLEDAVRLAVVASALSTQVIGAADSAPRYDEVLRHLDGGDGGS
jgi:ribokinase